MTKRNRRRLWLAWALSTVAATAYFATRFGSADQRAFLPGHTSAGHYQIELACTACHVEAFADRDAMQTACVACHGEALEAARDSHPQSKFTDPRNADRVAQLDARYCVTCHVEHEPGRTSAMGLTLPGDFCVACHADVAAERPTHEGMAFTSCGDAGCHNFHDNRALYEDFLLRHRNEGLLSGTAQLPARNFAEVAALLQDYPRERYPLQPIARAEQDAPQRAAATADLLAEWETTAHARSGVNCSSCHVSADDGQWRARAGYDVCGDCHEQEPQAFVRGRHGMRLDAARLGVALPPMRVEDARLPMRPASAERALDCGSCHAAHAFDTARAAVEACLECHADEHSLAYLGSSHHALWRQEAVGALPAGSGVSCATCHMPRTEVSYEWGAYVHVLVEHDQSANLRPTEKMLRSVCLQCHGYEFAVNALADPRLAAGNYDAQPSVVVQSTELAVRRRDELARQRAAERETN